jgi:hypothetical protein
VYTEKLTTVLNSDIRICSWEVKHCAFLDYGNKSLNHHWDSAEPDLCCHFNTSRIKNNSYITEKYNDYLFHAQLICKEASERGEIRTAKYTFLSVPNNRPNITVYDIYITSGKCMTNVNISSVVNFDTVTIKLLFLHQCFKYFITWLHFHTLLWILMMPCKI